MALRIAPPPGAAQQQAPSPNDLKAQLLAQLQAGAQPDTDSDPDDSGSDDSDDQDDDSQSPQVDQTTAGYQGPDQGPFMCANCNFFEISGPDSCAIVEGTIDHLGCCNMFTSSHAKSKSTDDTGDDDGAADGTQTGTSQPTTEPDEPEGT